jgi:hypothetical protein
MSKSAEEIRKELAQKRQQRNALEISSHKGTHLALELRELTEPRSAVKPHRLISGTQDIHRQPPHSVEAEMGVLGSMIIAPQDTIPEVVARVTADYFFLPAHQTIYEALVKLWRAGQAIDLITFTEHIRVVGQSETVGGPAFITNLFTFVPTAANVGYYLEIVRDKYLLRSLIATGTEAVRSAYEEQDDVAGVFEKVRASFTKIDEALRGDVEDFRLADLLSFDAANDPSNLLGARWLCRGSTCLWAGASGAGKSTLAMQCAIYWARGMSMFGIKPTRPLKSLILQAENDLGDTAEQFQGVLSGVRAETDDFKDDSDIAELTKNVKIKRVLAVTGDGFCGLLDWLLKAHRPDLVWIDPLFAFAGCDLKDSAEVSHFLRETLQPVVVNNGVCAMMIHHVGKPDRDSKAKSHWTELDFQYLGFGSSEIQNFFRAVNVILPVSNQEKMFRLILSKRGTKAGAVNTEGERATSIYLTHSEKGICWLQTDKPEEPQPQFKRSEETQFQSKFEIDDVLSEMGVAQAWKTGQLQKHLSAERGMKDRTFYRLWAKCKTEGKITCDSDGQWMRK